MTYCERVSVALVIYHAKLMCRIISSSVACVALPLPHNGTNFTKNILKIKLCFLFPLQLLSETYLILKITERDIIINVQWSSHKVPVILVGF